uniref:Uncharacterized protein n=1 Tax=Alexandrium monilatum TaxID=311494 RepID=A0A7S4SX49_9DINO
MPTYCLMETQGSVDGLEERFNKGPLAGMYMDERFPDSKGDSALQLPRCDAAARECMSIDLAQADALTDQECLDIALVQAAMRGDLHDAKRALQAGAKANTTADISLNMGIRDRRRVRRATPLMRACEFGREEVVVLLLGARADPVRKDSRMWTPRCYALGAGEMDCARRLLEAASGLAEEQREHAANLQASIVEQCREEVGEECAAQIARELEADGFLCPQGRPAPKAPPSK